MWNFYKAVIRSAIREFWTATDDVLTGSAVLSFLAILLNRKYGEHIVTTWNGISPWWSVIPIGLLVLYRLLRANYVRFALVKVERDEAVAKLELKTGLPPFRPVVAPAEYGQHKNGSYGLFIANDGYAAYEVSVSDVQLGASLRLTFSRKLPRLVDKDGKQFVEARLEHSDRSGRDGGHLFREMLNAGVGALKFAIMYKDTDFRWYRSNCVIGVAGEITFVGQELMPSPRS